MQDKRHHFDDFLAMFFDKFRGLGDAVAHLIKQPAGFNHHAFYRVNLNSQDFQADASYRTAQAYHAVLERVGHLGDVEAGRVVLHRLDELFSLNFAAVYLLAGLLHRYAEVPSEDCRQWDIVIDQLERVLAKQRAAAGHLAKY